ncbi:MAG: GNAT family N-acetyltransferase [Bacteroidetes bacterium]|nr:GNAT family N-acetyltransferase [Bacteroidota bacterium]MBU1113596.1 GNAT family N-acetyltransferase [Bacteroidota bacterium]MBU1796972.1 GNAT family N-acetyltransferase [Bacteroidota bacterium]
MNSHEVKFILDADVDIEMNNKLIEILSICFADQPIFNKQRYFKELPQYRWYLENNNEIIGHVALHKKEINTETTKLIIGGIAEVCVHPDHRGKGFVKLLLSHAHNFSIKNGYIFSMLFGDTNVYSSSGYKTIDNTIKYLDHISGEWKVEIIKDAMIKDISDVEWPSGLINLNGPTF